ncbi:MAG: hypothetical protein M3R04_02415 [bacterium]|nr:hypothetical protein [bacterium]
MDRQFDAVSIVWAVYGRSDAHPTVNWVTGDGLDCINPASGAPGFVARTVSGRECLNGITFTGGAVYVAWSDGITYSSSALAHELKHADQLRRGINDPFHLEAGAWEQVDQANTVLFENGL